MVNNEELARTILAIIAMAITPLAVCYFYLKRSCGSNKQVVVERTDNKVFLLRATFVFFILQIILSDIFGFGYWDYDTIFKSNKSIGHVFQYFGIIVTFIGDFLLIYTLHHLGKNWTMLVSKVENHELITSGPYRMARHPMYAALIVYFIGFFIISLNWFDEIGAILHMFVVVSRISDEERLMIREFGQQYIDYMSKTGAFCPCTICDCGLNLNDIQHEQNLLQNTQQQ